MSRSEMSSNLPVEITERIKNIDNIYKIVNTKLTPINKSYPLVSSDAPRVEIYFPNDAILNLANAILDADIWFNHRGNASGAAANNYVGDLSNVQTLGVSTGVPGTDATSIGGSASNPSLATGSIIAIVVCGVFGLVVIVIILGDKFGVFSCGESYVKAEAVERPDGNHEPNVGNLELANESA